MQIHPQRCLTPTIIDWDSGYVVWSGTLPLEEPQFPVKRAPSPRFKPPPRPVCVRVTKRDRRPVKIKSRRAKPHFGKTFLMRTDL